MTDEFNYDPRTTIEEFLRTHKKDAIWHLANIASQTYPDDTKDRVEGWLKHVNCRTKDANNPFRRTGTRASDYTNTSPPEQIWFGVYRGALSYLAGETGSGKSSALYNFAVHAAQDKPLWNVPFGLKRPLKVWMIDPENARLQAAWKMEKIGQGRPDNLVIDTASGVDLGDSNWQKYFRQWILDNNFDLVIIDPIVNLFMTANENDNAEAVQQMKFLQAISQETNAAILIVHHTGKGDGGYNSNYGRGASARLASADVGLVWRKRTGDETLDDTYNHELQGLERTDECRMQITKNRFGKYGSLYLRMAGNDRFEVSDWNAWRGKTDKSERKSQLQIAIENISNILIGGDCKSRSDLITMLKEQGIGETNADKALKQMCVDGNLEKRTHGKNGIEYAWAENITQRKTAK